MYVPIHVHYTTGSIGDSILRIKDAVNRTKEFGSKALAITDHGSLRSIVEFYNECNKQNIKPIIGLEAYEAKDNTQKNDERYHLILLAKNNEGYKNLLKISSNAHTEGFYYKPRTDFKNLKLYGKNIIGLSACVGGRIPKLILKLNEYGEENNTDKINKVNQRIIRLIEMYKDCFDDFYLELQPGNFREQIIVNQYLIEYAKATDTKLVVTNDVHYLNPDDYKYHDYHVKLCQGNNEEIDKNVLYYPDTCYYMMNESDLREKLSYIDKDILDSAIKNTELIADSINYNELFNSKVKMPPVDLKNGYNADDMLAEIAYNNLNNMEYELDDPTVYYSKLEEELSTLKTVGFSSYLLTILDFYKYAKRNNILLGPGRGSICGSLTAYLIGLTKVDPIKYDLRFNRFTSIYRIGSVPDVDTDCISNQRQELFDYAIKKYGFDNCAQVTTFCYRKAKGALRDTARLFNIDEKEVNEIVSMIPEAYYDKENDNEKISDIPISFARQINPDLDKIAKREKYKEWFNVAEHLEYLPSHLSKHAAGMVISPERLDNYIPCYVNDDGILTTEFTLKDVEACGGIKYDFLGLSSLEVIQNVIDDCHLNIKLDSDEFYNDDATWDLISSGKTSTLFQVNSYLYRKRMPRIRPRSIEELANCIALIRTPCISSQLDEKYMAIINNEDTVEHIHPIYDKVTENTNGILLFQEQLMDLLEGLGASKERGFQIMKYGTKKKMDKLDAAKQEVYELAKDKMDDATFEKIWHIIYFTGLFCFNKSHAVAYAIVTYLTAYLCCHYPNEWYAASINKFYTSDNEKKNKQKIVTIYEECKWHNIKILPVNSKYSSWPCKATDEGIRLGYVCVKGIGKKSSAVIDEIHDCENFSDLYKKHKCGKTIMIDSIFVGAFDDYGNRMKLYEQYCEESKNKATYQIKVGKTYYDIKEQNLNAIQKALMSI